MSIFNLFKTMLLASQTVILNSYGDEEHAAGEVIFIIGDLHERVHLLFDTC